MVEGPGIQSSRYEFLSPAVLCAALSPHDCWLSTRNPKEQKQLPEAGNQDLGARENCARERIRSSEGVRPKTKAKAGQRW